MCNLGSLFSFVALDHLSSGTQVRMRMVQLLYESPYESHHMDSGELLQSNQTSLLCLDDTISQQMEEKEFNYRSQECLIVFVC